MKLLNLSRGAAGSRVPPASRSSAGPACSPLPAAAARGASRRLVSAAAAGPGAASFSGSTGQASFFSSDSGSTGSPAGQQLSPLQRWAQQNRQLQERLKSLGIAGVVAYGIFNTLYYTCAFLFVWLYVAKVPSGLGPAKAAQAFAQVFGMVWAGSQVTKLARAGAALAFAPLVDSGLERLAGMLRLRGKQQAFLVVLAGCVTLALLLFGTVVLAHA